jgi:hypothetical protein
MVLGINNEGATLVGGSLRTPGGRMKTVKIVIVGKGVYVKLERGSVLAQPGDVVDAPENEAKIVLGLRRARLFDPAIDSPPTPAVPEGEPDPEVPQPRTGRGARKTEIKEGK